MDSRHYFKRNASGREGGGGANGRSFRGVLMSTVTPPQKAPTKPIPLPPTSSVQMGASGGRLWLQQAPQVVALSRGGGKSAGRVEQRGAQLPAAQLPAERRKHEASTGNLRIPFLR